MAKSDNYDIQLGIQARVYSYSLLYDSSIIATNCFLSVKHPLYVCVKHLTVLKHSVYEVFNSHYYNL